MTTSHMSEFLKNREGMIVKQIVLASAILVTGCSSVKTVSPEEADQVIKAVQAPGPVKIDKVVWVQPDNKSEACKTYFLDPPADTSKLKVTWDGACKDGYAFGLGREFVVGGGHDQSMVATYVGGKVKPQYHSSNNYSLGLYGYGDPDKGVAFVSKTGNAATGEGYEQVLAVRQGESTYARRYTVASGEMTFVKLFPSDFAVMITTPSDPTSPVQKIIALRKGSLYANYGIVKYRNGSVEMKKIEGGQFVPARLPENYLAFLASVTTDINNQLSSAERYADESARKVADYKAAFCSKRVVPQEPLHYRDICGAQGDMTSANVEISAIIAKREARFAQGVANQRQSMIQAAQIQAINNQAAEAQSLELSNSLNDLNNTLRQQTNSINQNSYQAPAIPDYGQRPTYDTTCYDLGAVVRCNTR